MLLCLPAYILFNPFSFFFGCARSSLQCGLFSRCGQWGLLFVVVHGLLIFMTSLIEERRLQGMQTSVVAISGLQSTNLVVMTHGFSCFSGMWVLPRSGIEHVSPSLARRFFTTEPPGKLLESIPFKLCITYSHVNFPQFMYTSH